MRRIPTSMFLLLLISLCPAAPAQDASPDDAKVDADTNTDTDADANPTVAPPTAPPSEPPPLLIATRHVPPFAIKNPDGTWTGIAIELWRMIGEELGYTTPQFREMSLDEMLDAVANDEVDAAVGALTVTAEREARMDFAHPFYTTGLGIAVKPRGGTSVWAVIGRIFSWQFVQVVGLLLLVLFGVGVVVWLVERRRNREQFGGTAARGLGSAFWWSAVTMTTVGYGDKAPITVAGRVVGLIWMFAAIIIISSFTAMITSALTVSQLETGITGPGDLPGLTVATVRDSTSARWLAESGAEVKEYDTVEQVVSALADGDVDAAVYDAPMLQYVINKHHGQRLTVLPSTFERQDYAIALPRNSALRKPVNRVLVEEIRGTRWRQLLMQYLGTVKE